jgi:hypothetical protein
MAHVRTQLVAQLTEEVAPETKNPTEGATSAFHARRALQLHREYKQCAATVKALVARALRMLRSARFSVSHTGSVAQALGFMYLRIYATRAYANQKKKHGGVTDALTSVTASLKTTSERAFTQAAERVREYKAHASAELGREPYAMNIADFGKAQPHHRTPNTIAMIDTFLLTGVLRTLHELDKTITVVVFELAAKRKAKPPPPAYVRAIGELREALVQFIMERRSSVSLRVSDAASTRLRVSELGTILVQHANNALRLIMDRIYETPLGVAFACSASSIAVQADARPYGVTSAFDYEWSKLERSDRPKVSDVTATGEIFDSELPQGLASGVDANRPYVFGPHADY